MANTVADNLFQQQQNELKLTFRRTLLFYLKENANPRLLLKLMQITKFFCSKEFPFFVVEKLKIEHISQDNADLQWTYLPFPFNDVTVERIDKTKISKKLWVKNSLYVYADNNNNHASMILPKVAVCDISKLFLRNQVLSFNEFMFLVSSNNITYLNMDSSIVRYDDGTILALEKYFGCLKSLTSFRFSIDGDMASTITKETAKNLTNLINPSRLTIFDLHYIPDTFDFNVFKEFMKLNPTIIYKLHFRESQKLQYDLDIYNNTLIKNGLTEHPPPFVSYSFQDAKTYNALHNFHIEYYLRLPSREKII